MAPQFCDDCGTILDESGDAHIVCDRCGKPSANIRLTQQIVSTSESTNFPSRLRDKLRSHTGIVTDRRPDNNRTIQVPCLNCDAKEVTWSELQLRSADEGTTIFYRCPKCNHRWSPNPFTFFLLSSTLILKS
ncbi:hypothetical protein ACJ72_04657 [Emergomyces africanus]|uniref:DNA-directed RNA polymerase subunit n=1 Tax=Emergomyces africanus TaxID=1955775 RepID=A0A1B7NW44_9EURO|nr:hypothetical protein ACJ72_04657 [Emergomyces africanus]